MGTDLERVVDKNIIAFRYAMNFETMESCGSGVEGGGSNEDCFLCFYLVLKKKHSENYEIVHHGD